MFFACVGMNLNSAKNTDRVYVAELRRRSVHLSKTAFYVTLIALSLRPGFVVECHLQVGCRQPLLCNACHPHILQTGDAVIFDESLQIHWF